MRYYAKKTNAKKLSKENIKNNTNIKSQIKDDELKNLDNNNNNNNNNTEKIKSNDLLKSNNNNDSNNKQSDKLEPTPLQKPSKKSQKPLNESATHRYILQQTKDTNTQGKNTKKGKNKKSKSRIKPYKRKKIIRYIIKYMLLIIIFLTSIFIANYIFNFNIPYNLNTNGIITNVFISSSENANEKSLKIMQLEELQKENSDIKALIQIDGTNIDYPVLQTTDNSFYLDHDYNKNYSYTGSIYLDKDVDMSKPSSNFLIYGHSMLNDTMFDELINYKDEEFYKEHKYINFITNDEEATFEIMAVFYSRVYYKSETNVFRYYYFIDASDEQEYNDYVENSKKASIYDTGIDACFGDQLLTLSTCNYSQEDGRFAIVAKKIKQ